MSETDLVTTGTAPEAGAPDTPGGTAAPTRRKGLSTMVLAELRQLAGELNIADTAKMRKGDLIAAIRERQAGGPVPQLPLPTPAATSTNGDGTAAAEAAADEAPAPARRRRRRLAARRLAAQGRGHRPAPAAEPARRGLAPHRRRRRRVDRHARPSSRPPRSRLPSSRARHSAPPSRPTASPLPDARASAVRAASGPTAPTRARTVHPWPLRPSTSLPRPRGGRRRGRPARRRPGQRRPGERRPGERAQPRRPHGPRRTTAAADGPERPARRPRRPHRTTAPNQRDDRDTPRRRRRRRRRRPRPARAPLPGPPPRPRPRPPAEGGGGQSTVDTEVRDDDVLLPGRRHPRRPRQLRVRPHLRLPGRPERRLRVAVAGPQVRPAPRRRGHRRGPRSRARASSSRQKFNPLVRLDTINGHGPGGGPQPARVQQAHPALPAGAAAAGDRAAHPDHPGHRPGHADRQGPARADRLAAEGRQDHDPAGDRQRDHHATTPSATSWSCSSTSGPKRSPTCSGR